MLFSKALPQKFGFGRACVLAQLLLSPSLGTMTTDPRLSEEVAVPETALFKEAFPYQEDVLALPVVDVDVASQWYSKTFGLKEVERRTHPHPTVILERDGVRIGFSINGGDASQDGAAILVSDISRAKEQIEANGISIGNWRVDERDGQKLQVFLVVAPDGLCFYFHQPI
jgi:catechol 2,3-dioxygenase-like lactoylglutathione lyase family enzyme